MLAVPVFLLLPSLLHVWVGHCMQRYEGLLDGLGRGPLQHVVGPSSLVVGPRKPGSTEWLLTHYGSGGLVVDVEVPGRSLQQLSRLVSEFPGGKIRILAL